MNHAPSTRIDSLSKLKMEKGKLETYCSYQEKLIGLKIDYFKENYPKVLGEALLPYDPVQNTKVSDLLDSVNSVIANLFPGIFKGKPLPGFVLKLVQILMIRMFNKAKG
ncbi:MAG: hypothetical protein M1445_07420 [Bacteroidetes bacterium]|nr:hypothetical protein [Bacteroidota bacterium]MCL6103468.1 hypothetical protein [Bacteroidota bacterium]